MWAVRYVTVETKFVDETKRFLRHLNQRKVNLSITARAERLSVRTWASRIKLLLLLLLLVVMLTDERHGPHFFLVCDRPNAVVTLYATNSHVENNRCRQSSSNSVRFVLLNKYECTSGSGTDGRRIRIRDPPAASRNQVWMRHRWPPACRSACRFTFTGGGSLYATYACIYSAYAYLEIMMSYQKSDSVNRYVCTWRTITPNFILIRFETTEHYAI